MDVFSKHNHSILENDETYLLMKKEQRFREYLQKKVKSIQQIREKTTKTTQ